MALQRYDLFSGDKQNPTLHRGIPETFSFGGKIVKASRLFGFAQPGRKLTSPTGAPVGDPYGVSWSPSGRIFMAGYDVAPWIGTWEFDGENWVGSGGILGGAFSGTMQQVAWNSDETVVAITSDGAPYVQVFSYSPYGAPYAALADPAVPPASFGRGAKWSPDGRFLAVTSLASPFLDVYEFSSLTLNKLSNPDNLPTGYAYSCDWSPDGRYLAVGHATSPFLSVYSFDGENLIRITNPTSPPTNTVGGVSWSPDGRVLGLVQQAGFSYHGIHAYDFSDGVFGQSVLLTADYIPNWGGSCQWSPDGRYFAVGHRTVGGGLAVYSFDGVTFNSTRYGDDLPVEIMAVQWSPDGKYLATADLSGVNSGLAIYESDLGSPAGGSIVELEPSSNVN